MTAVVQLQSHRPTDAETLSSAARLLELARGKGVDDRRRLLEAEMEGGELFELRVAVENRPGTVAEIALALGRARVNIEDMALYPAADMRTGAITLWVAGAEEAERAAGVIRELGHTASVLGGEE